MLSIMSWVLSLLPPLSCHPSTDHLGPRFCSNHFPDLLWSTAEGDLARVQSETAVHQEVLAFLERRAFLDRVGVFDLDLWLASGEERVVDAALLVVVLQIRTSTTICM